MDKVRYPPGFDVFPLGMVIRFGASDNDKRENSEDCIGNSERLVCSPFRIWDTSGEDGLLVRQIACFGAGLPFES